ncbi:hypothetical protein HMPREF0083_00497 [Aneurinibacillus aneurinilyticus ATCC 12856]|uniref:Uncharacterized protein n=1 Tax=Aneurinibacillus aneurinilyticus ATCC 12856 TaxID=649747 RepID=U1WS31_ANEAE|nr:hypothetical protein HMPREF0083_00497 [Aneurinibacillus aneurinilyticus ATCC 12856]
MSLFSFREKRQFFSGLVTYLVALTNHLYQIHFFSPCLEKLNQYK